MAGRLGDILVARGQITEEQLQAALAAQGSERGMLGAILVSRGLVTEDQVGSALSEQFSVPYHDVVPEATNPQLVRLLPESLARERELLPLGVHDGDLTLAMTAPDDIEAISEVELITGYRVQPVVAMQQQVLATLDRGFDERVSARQTIVDMKIADLEEASNRGDVDEILDAGEDEDAPVIRLVRSIMMGAVNAGASDIHLEPHDPQMRARFRVDGQLQEVMTIPNHIEEAVVGRIKVMADMDTTEKRRPQDGTLSIDENGIRASFRVSSVPTVDGEKVVMRILDEGNKIFTFDALGMPEREAKLCQSLIDKPHGMIVVTGPTGSGKTTTMYTMLSAINSVTRNIVTVEDPVEYRLPGVNQVHADADHGLGFANALKYIMRQDPDVILVGEIRDHETATTAVQAALTGHLLISTLHTNDAVGSVARLSDLGLDYFKIGGSLLASVAQRLLRAVCDECKQPVQPNEGILQSLLGDRELPASATFFAGRGCKKCLGTGFLGRIPIYEIMSVTPAITEKIELGVPASKLRELAIDEGMIELVDGGLEQAMAGKTTLEEVYYKLSS